MPSSPGIDEEHLLALLAFLHTQPHAAPAGSAPAAPLSGDRSETRGAALYDRNCAICHEADLSGGPSNYPGLVGVRARLGDARILANIHNGKGRMPAFPHLTDTDTAAILRFLGPAPATLRPLPEVSSKQEAVSASAPAEGAAKYRFTGYRKFLDPDGYPAIVPPGAP